MPPNQLAHDRSRTPGMLRIVSAWLVGMLKIIDVDRSVMIRVDELALAAALKPSSTARRDAKRNTASATLTIVRTVRRLLRRALFRIRPRYFMPSPPRSASPFRGAARGPR